MWYLDKCSPRLLFAGFSLAILIAVFVCYLPGLKGEFILDDYGNLPPLFDAVKESGILYGSLSGTSGPLGRPLTLFSFALQSEYWPNPYYFKYVNLILHLVNTILVCCLARLLSPYLLVAVKTSHYNVFALCIAAIWSLLPIHVSTVLYVVQRMVILSSLFVLLGCIFYIYARHFLVEGKYKLSAVFFFNTLLFALLAILSKESGLLIFAFLLCIEQIIKIKRPIMNTYHKWSVNSFLLTPLVLFCVYIIYFKFYGSYGSRPFNLEERLLSETRVLWVYIHQIALPKPSDLGVYHEAFKISRGFFDPVSTIVSCCAWVFVWIATIWALVKKKIQFFFPCIWFFSGHLMESTVIALELYFEHRNYLASLGVVFLGAFIFIFLFKRIKGGVLKALFSILAVIYLVVIVLILNMQTKLWGNPFLFKYVHATERVDSMRARALLVDYYQELGRSKEAYQALEGIEKDFPNEPALYFLKLQFRCSYSDWVPTPDLNRYSGVLQSGEFSHGALKSVEDLVNFKSEKSCPAVSYSVMLESLALLKSNPNYAHKYHFIARFESLLYIQQNDLDNAIRALGSILHQGYDDAISYARILAAAHRFDEALVAVGVARQNLGSGIIKRQREAELDELIHFINDDKKAYK